MQKALNLAIAAALAAAALAGLFVLAGYSGAAKAVSLTCAERFCGLVIF